MGEQFSAALAAILSLWLNSLPSPEDETYPQRLIPDKMQLTGQSSIRHLYWDFPWSPAIYAETSCTTQQSAIADALTNKAVLWTLSLFNVTSTNPTRGSPLSDQQSAVHIIRDNYYQPYALTACNEPTYLNMKIEAPLL